VDRRSTVGLAERLIAAAGSLPRVLQADREFILRVSGSRSVAALLPALHQAHQRLLERQIDGRPVLASWQALLDYLHLAMAHRLHESARVLHLDVRNALIRDEQVSSGSINQAPIYVREVARRALELGSAAVILVHNHPSGDPTPSRQDVALTRDLARALRPFEVQVHDHLIIGVQGHASMRALGML